MLPLNPTQAFAALVDIAGEPIHCRRAFVVDLLHKVIDECSDQDSALLVLDLAGLAGDRDVIDEALTAHALWEGLRAGTIDPYEQDPDIKVGREHAIEVLSEEAQSSWIAAVARLALTKVEHSGRVHDVRAELAAAAAQVAL
jgi:hypothetical protein